MVHAHILVMAKAPIPGRVKTRLCPPCTPEEAAAIAEASLIQTLEAAKACGANKFVVALEGKPGEWLPEGFTVIPQVAGTLNVRLAAAWAAVGAPGLQIGMDTPQVTPTLLDRCFGELFDDNVDATLGLAPDGGWWAIGMRKDHQHAFDNVSMSQSNTGAMQLRQMKRLGLRVGMLEELCDVDHFDDAVTIAAEMSGSSFEREVNGVVLRIANANTVAL